MNASYRRTASGSCLSPNVDELVTQKPFTGVTIQTSEGPKAAKIGQPTRLENPELFARHTAHGLRFFGGMTGAGAGLLAAVPTLAAGAAYYITTNGVLVTVGFVSATTVLSTGGLVAGVYGLYHGYHWLNTRTPNEIEINIKAIDEDSAKGQKYAENVLANNAELHQMCTSALNMLGATQETINGGTHTEITNMSNDVSAMSDDMLTLSQVLFQPKIEFADSQHDDSCVGNSEDNIDPQLNVSDVWNSLTQRHQRVVASVSHLRSLHEHASETNTQMTEILERQQSLLSKNEESIQGTATCFSSIQTNSQRVLTSLSQQPDSPFTTAKNQWVTGIMSYLILINVIRINPRIAALIAISTSTFGITVFNQSVSAWRRFSNPLAYFKRQ
jgi:hypothetical protein